jgi:hypothetical protein
MHDNLDYGLSDCVINIDRTCLAKTRPLKGYVLEKKAVHYGNSIQSNSLTIMHQETKKTRSV